MTKVYQMIRPGNVDDLYSSLDRAMGQAEMYARNGGHELGPAANWSGDEKPQRGGHLINRFGERTGYAVWSRPVY